MILSRSQHSVVKKMKQVVMAVVDEICCEDVEFKFFLTDNEVMTRRAEERMLNPERLGATFRFTFQEPVTILKTEVYVKGELFSEIPNRTKVDEGFSVYTSIEISS